MCIAKSQWAAGDFGQRVRESVTRASIRLDMSQDNVAGVTLPKFVIRENSDSDANLEKVGVFGGGQVIEQARQKFHQFLRIAIDIASLQTSFLTLDEVIKVTNRRVNALEFIVIPRFQSVVQYIIQELDEMAREEKFTMKKVLENRTKLAIEAEMMVKKSAQEQSGIKVDATAGNALAGDDEDLIF